MVVLTTTTLTGMVSQIYYAEHEKQLVKLIGSECSGWYTPTSLHLLWYTYYGHLLWHTYYGWYAHLATLTVAALDDHASPSSSILTMAI